MTKHGTNKTHIPALPHPESPAEQSIVLRIDSGYVVARCGNSFAVYELVWENRHGDSRRHLTLRECVEIPRQFEREMFSHPPAGERA